jgi:hypothetical protein
MKQITSSITFLPVMDEECEYEKHRGGRAGLELTG